MPCPICGKAHIITPVGIAGMRASPTCRCGKIRLRERLKGCAKCGEQSTGIQMKKHWYGYLLYCICGHKWRIRK